MEVDPGAFRGLVADALDLLPQEFADRLTNVDIVVADEPTSDQLQDAGLGPGESLFGLYEGIPQTEREHYSLALPDKITIFRGPLSRACRTGAEIRDEVAITVIHEIAHHFGISDERLEELGW